MGSGKILFSEDLFIDSIELSKLNDFIFQDGFIQLLKDNILSFGIIKNNYDYNFDAFKASQGQFVNLNPTITFNLGRAIAYNNSTGKINIIQNNEQPSIVIPSLDTWYWVNIKPNTNSIEKGVVSVDSNGNVVGDQYTQFTKLLRSQPNFPSTIRFKKLSSVDNYTYQQSSLNSEEYEVLEVIDDNHLIIQGEFTNETDLRYEIVGTFTPMFNPIEENKCPFKYDDCLFSLVEETSEMTKPSYNQNEEFYIYRIKYSSGQIYIQDFRNEIFKLNNFYTNNIIDNEPISSIGIVKCKHDSIETTQVENLLLFEWGVESKSYSVDFNTNKITLNSFNGGRIKTINDFNDGDFNGYLLCVISSTLNNSSYDNSLSSIERILKIKSSLTNGSSIDLVLEKLSYFDIMSDNYNNVSSYKNNDIVKTNSGTYKLCVDTSTGIAPSTSVWNGTTSYTSNMTVVRSGDTYKCLQSNINKQPESNSNYWQLIWKMTFIEIVVVPDCENIVVNVQLGEDVASNYDFTPKQFVYPTVLGKCYIPLVAQNDNNDESLVYNISYRKLSNGVYSNELYLQNSSYEDENGNNVDYDTTYKKNAFIRSMKSLNNYTFFKNRVDLGDLNGWFNVSNLETYASSFPSRNINVNVGEYKNKVIFTGSSELTSNITFLLDETALSGNEFEFYFKSKINNNSKNIIFKKGTTVLLTIGNELLQGQQIIKWTYDEDNGWTYVISNNGFIGNNSYTQQPALILNTSTYVSTASDGGKILTVSGFENTILINDDAEVGSIRYIKFTNYRPVNELYIGIANDSSDVSFELGGSLTDSTLYAFNNNKADYGEANIKTLTQDRIIHFVLTRLNNASNGKIGYLPIADTFYDRISSIQGLQTALDGKASAYHTHVLGNVSDIITGIAHVGDFSDNTTITIAIGKTLPNTNYAVFISLYDPSGVIPTMVYAVTSNTTTNFNVTLWESGSGVQDVYVMWMITPIQVSQ